MKRILFLGIGPITIELIKTLQVVHGFVSIDVISMKNRNYELRDIQQLKPVEWLDSIRNMNYDFVVCSWRDSEINSTRYSIINKLLSVGNPQFIFLSSVAVYGECDKPKNEQSSTSPINSYGKTKYQLECQLRDLLSDRVTSLRISNVFGNKQFKDFINLVIKSSRDRSVIRINNPMVVTRDFISQETVIEILLAIIQSANSFRIKDHSILNVSSGVSYRLNDVLTYLNLNFNLSIQSIVFPPSSETILNSRIENSLLRKHFDLKLKDPLESIGDYFDKFSRV